MQALLAQVRTTVVDGTTYYCCLDITRAMGLGGKCTGCGNHWTRLPTVKLRPPCVRRCANFCTLDTATRYYDLRTFPGDVYAFTPIGNSSIVKFGRTTTTRRHYQGLNKPKHVLMRSRVKNCWQGERDLLEFAHEHPFFTQRLDLGREWFETALSTAALKKLFADYHLKKYNTPLLNNDNGLSHRLPDRAVPGHA